MRAAVEAEADVEFRLLLECLPPSFGGHGVAASLELPPEGVNWERLLRLAAMHEVVPLVAERLAAQGLMESAVPPVVKKALRDNARAVAGRNLRLAAELAAISEAFAAQGIAHVPYKGIVLAQLLYSNIALRSMCDMDLLVRPEDKKKAIACLEELGFADDFELAAAQRQTALRYGYEYSFSRGEVSVDLHWRLVQKFAWPSLNMERIWDSLEPFALYGRQYRVFSPEVWLATLGVHSAQHGEQRSLKMFVDIAVLLAQHKSLDWDKVYALVADSHSRRSLAVALLLAHQYLGAPLPPEVARRIASDAQAASLAQKIAREHWPAPDAEWPDDSSLSTLLSYTRGEAPADRWRFVSGVIFGLTLDDFWWVKLPPALGPLYFALRPLRLAWKRLRRR